MLTAKKRAHFSGGHTHKCIVWYLINEYMFKKIVSMWQPVLCETKRLAWPKLAIGNFLPSRQLRQLLTAICGAKNVISRLQNMAFANSTLWLTKQKDIIENIIQIFDWNPLSPQTVTTQELLRAKLSFTDDKSGRRQKLRVEKIFAQNVFLSRSKYISLQFKMYFSLVQIFHFP